MLNIKILMGDYYAVQHDKLFWFVVSSITINKNYRQFKKAAIIDPLNLIMSLKR